MLKVGLASEARSTKACAKAEGRVDTPIGHTVSLSSTAKFWMDLRAAFGRALSVIKTSISVRGATLANMDKPHLLESASRKVRRAERIMAALTLATSKETSVRPDSALNACVLRKSLSTIRFSRSRSAIARGLPLI